MLSPCPIYEKQKPSDSKYCVHSWEKNSHIKKKEKEIKIKKKKKKKNRVVHVNK